VRVYPLEGLPWGLDLAHDLERRAPSLTITTVFDVGANVGQSALEFGGLFPEATVWSFEPFEEPYVELERATRGRRVRCFRLALGAEPATVEVAPDAHSVQSSLIPAGTGSGTATETVEVTTIDAFAAEHGIDRIDLLKIDTEGYELEVLKGAEESLRRGAVTLVEVEAGMTPSNRKHVPFEVLKAHLEERGYVLFGVYVQVPEWSGEPRLRFANPVFAVGSVANLPPS
jgi:FkbM family methyltransferase